ncbi:MAG: MATE family efflux transporter [Lachnospiraceae bacterium]|nr:MATE family efflux transporter [Lachnospiraceae bacterium]
MKSKVDFINEKTTRALMKLFIPLMLAMTLTMAYSMVDSLWVGNLLGEAGMSALTASTAIVLIMNSLSMGVGNGVSVMIAQRVGAKDMAGVKRAAAVIMTVSLVFSGAICLVGEFASEFLLAAMGTPTAVLADAVSYLRLYLVGNVALFVYMQFTSIFRAFGDSVFQMKGMLLTVIVNAILDPIMIKWWGFNGVAIATVISEVLCLAYALLYHNRKKWFSFDFKAMTWEDVKTMSRLCVPTSIQSIMPALSSAVMITFVNPFGLTALAGYGVVRNLELIMFMPTNAMSMAVTSIVGQCKGAGRMDRARDYCKTAMLTGGILIGLSSTLVIFTSPILSGCFGQGAEVGAIVAEFFHIVSIGYVLYMLTSCVQGYITGIGRPEKAMLLLIAYYIIFRVPAAVILKAIFGLPGIWLAFLVSHILACVLAFIMLQISYNRQKICSSVEISA